MLQYYDTANQAKRVGEANKITMGVKKKNTTCNNK